MTRRLHLMWDGVASSCTANMQCSALDMGNAILFYPIHLSKDDVAEGTACNYEVDVSELAHCMEYGMTAPTHVQFSLLLGINISVPSCRWSHKRRCVHC